MLFTFNQLCNRRCRRFQPSSRFFSCQGFLHFQGTVIARLLVRAFSSDYSYGRLFNSLQGTHAADQTMYCCRLQAFAVDTASTPLKETTLPHEMRAGHLCLSSEWAKPHTQLKSRISLCYRSAEILLD